MREKATWVYICRAGKDVPSDQLNFDFVGLIGIGNKGGTCFFNTRPGVRLASQIAKYPNPKGDATVKKTIAINTWMAPSEMEVCTSCHIGWPLIRSWFAKPILSQLPVTINPQGDFSIASHTQIQAGFAYQPMENVPKAPDGNACDDCHKLPGKGEDCRTFINAATQVMDFTFAADYLGMPEGAAMQRPYMPPWGSYGGAYDDMDAWQNNWASYIEELMDRCQ